MDAVSKLYVRGKLPRFIIMRHEVRILHNIFNPIPYNCFQILSQCTAAGLHRAGQLDQLVPADRCEWDGRPVALGGSSWTNCWFRRAA